MAQASATLPVPSASQSAQAASSAVADQRRLRDRRIATLKQRYESSDKEVADETDKLSRTHPPSRFAFLALITAAILMDTAVDALVEFLNIAAFLGVVIDIILTTALMLCLRAMINRTKGTQRLFAVLLIVGVLISVIFAGIGSIIGGPMVLVVIIAGIWNPGVKVHKVDKEKFQENIRRYERAVTTARQKLTRLIRAGRRSKSTLVRSATRKIAKSGAFKAFSKGSKTLSRFLGTFVGEIIPFISLIPFNTITTYLTYRDLKRAHAEALELLALYREQRDAAVTAESAVVQAEYEQQAEEIETEAAQAAEESDAQSRPPVRTAAPAPQGSSPRQQPVREPSVPQTPPRGTMRDVAAPAAA